MDPVLKFGLAIDITTKAQDWRDRVIVASVIAKYPIDDREKWCLAKKLARHLATAKGPDERRRRLEMQSEISGVDLWTLGWLSDKGFVSDHLFGFKWSEVLKLVSGLIDSDMQKRRAEVRKRGRNAAIQNIVEFYNIYIGGDAFTIERAFKMITSTFEPKAIAEPRAEVEVTKESTQHQNNPHADHHESRHEDHQQRHQEYHETAHPEGYHGHYEAHQESLFVTPVPMEFKPIDLESNLESASPFPNMVENN
jgi:hypothetical protein